MSRCNDEALTTPSSDGHSMPLCPLESRLSLPSMPMGTPQLSNALLFLDAFGNGDFPSFSSGSEYAISSSAFLPSNVPDSELQASVFHTLDVGTGGWGDCRCCVQRHAVEVPLSRIIKTRLHDLHLLLPCRTFQLGQLWNPRWD